MKMELKGNFGKCVFGDCVKLLEECEKFDVAFVDPPYNVHTDKQRTSKNGKIYSKDVTVSYDNDFSKADYENFSRTWFDSLKRIASRIIITPGRDNELWWRNAYPFKVMIWIIKNGQSRCSISQFARYEPILFYNFDKTYVEDYVDVYLNNGFLRFDQEIGILVHPHPKPSRLVEKILLPAHPMSVIDPMLGSGTTAFVCEKHGIPWLGFEILEAYASDIKKQIQAGVQEYEKI